jgi:hypothetical protein
MRYLLGIAFFALAFALLVGARRYRDGIRARFDAAAFARHRAEALRSPRSMAAFGQVARPFVMFALFYVAIKTTIAFVAFDGAQALSWFDLAGFHALLAGYGVWFTVRTNYWLPEGAIAAHDLERELAAHMRDAAAADAPVAADATHAPSTPASAGPSTDLRAPVAPAAPAAEADAPAAGAATDAVAGTAAAEPRTRRRAA